MKSLSAIAADSKKRSFQKLCAVINCSLIPNLVDCWCHVELSPLQFVDSCRSKMWNLSLRQKGRKTLLVFRSLLWFFGLNISCCYLIFSVFVISLIKITHWLNCQVLLPLDSVWNKIKIYVFSRC